MQVRTRRAPRAQLQQLPDHQAQWFMPQPLWRALPPAELRARRAQPQLLRFTSDAFMEDLSALLATGRGAALRDYVAQYETWREPRAGLDPDGRDRPGALRLYQPAHGRFYLVAGALACRVPGVPDRAIDATAGESVFFVMRRLGPVTAPDGQLRTVEYGWSTGQAARLALPVPDDPRAPQCQQPAARGWVALDDPDHTLLCDEERLPLFPISFQQDGVTRRLLAGLVPVGSRETYAAGPNLSALPAGADLARPGGDPRPLVFEQQVTDVLAGLRALAPRSSLSTTERAIFDRASTFMLLDLMRLLDQYVHPLYETILSVPGSSLADAVPPALGDVAAAIHLLLNARGDALGDALELARLIYLTFHNGTYLVDVLRAIEADRATLEAIESEQALDDDWIFPWQTSHVTSWLGSPGAAGPAPVQQRFEQALPAPGATATVADGTGEAPPELPKLDPQGEVRYVLRLVYDRPHCRMPVISAPTRAFTLAPFFDPDAPARPIRIAMPVDTSPEGLRKYPRGVAVMISDQLRKQMARVKGLQELMDGDLSDEPNVDFGMICSLSIPIITICALILLMIIVQLLNIIFWWLPFFKICFPLNLTKR